LFFLYSTLAMILFCTTFLSLFVVLVVYCIVLFLYCYLRMIFAHLLTIVCTIFYFLPILQRLPNVCTIFVDECLFFTFPMHFVDAYVLYFPPFVALYYFYDVFYICFNWVNQSVNIPVVCVNHGGYIGWPNTKNTQVREN
jgi:hypothetical protein